MVVRMRRFPSVCHWTRSLLPLVVLCILSNTKKKKCEKDRSLTCTLVRGRSVVGHHYRIIVVSIHFHIPRPWRSGVHASLNEWIGTHSFTNSIDFIKNNDFPFISQRQFSIWALIFARTMCDSAVRLHRKTTKLHLPTSNHLFDKMRFRLSFDIFSGRFIPFPNVIRLANCAEWKHGSKSKMWFRSSSITYERVHYSINHTQHWFLIHIKFLEKSKQRAATAPGNSTATSAHPTCEPFKK